MILPIDRLRYSSMRCYDKDAVVCDEDRVSYRQFYAAVLATAQELKRIGVVKGDKVGVYQRNSISFLVNFFGIMAAGGCAVLLNWRWVPKEVRHALQISDCKFCVVDAAFYGAAIEALENLGCDGRAKYLLVAEKYGLVGEEFIADSQAIVALVEKDIRVASEPSDDGLIFFTGGSTGFPKAAVHGLGGLSNWVDATLSNAWTITARDVVMDPAPLFHLGGMQCALFSLSTGATLILTSGSFSAGKVLDLIDAEKVTQALLIPATLIQDLRKEQEACPRDLRSVTDVLIMGSAIRDSYAENAFAIFPNADLVHPYGMSELAATCIMRHSREEWVEHPERHASVGRIGMGSEIKLLDEDGKPVPDGTPGRVFGKAVNMMKGYMGLDEGIDEEGYLDTGDVLVRDENQYYYYVGRTKLMVKTGGENVYCNEVEGIIRKHPAVYDCIVFGLPDEKWGETVCCAIELKAGCNATAEEIIDHCRNSAAHYKQPRRVFFVSKLPLNPAGKILVKDVLTMLGLD